jgi:effector-binding domain-containing protein
MMPSRRSDYRWARGRGPAPDILAAYDALAAHAKEKGHALGGPPRETYLVDPWSRAPQMEVAFPLL